jgi:hypothetical protein
MTMICELGSRILYLVLQPPTRTSISSSGRECTGLRLVMRGRGENDNAALFPP